MTTSTRTHVVIGTGKNMCMLKQVSQAHVMSAPYRPAPHGMRLFGSALYILRWLALASHNVRQPLSPDNKPVMASAETPRILDQCLLESASIAQKLDSGHCKIVNF